MPRIARRIKNAPGTCCDIAAAATSCGGALVRVAAQLRRSCGGVAAELRRSCGAMVMKSQYHDIEFRNTVIPQLINNIVITQLYYSNERYIIGMEQL